MAGKNHTDNATYGSIKEVIQTARENNWTVDVGGSLATKAVQMWLIAPPDTADKQSEIAAAMGIEPQTAVAAPELIVSNYPDPEMPGRSLVYFNGQWTDELANRLQHGLLTFAGVAPPNSDNH